jgi:hypothetical protein
MSKIIEETLYTIDELKENFPEVYKKAIEKNADINVDYAWYDCIEYDYTEQLEKIGFYDLKIQFSGFYSQGDGASFSGKWYKNNVDLSKVDIEELYSDKIKYLYYTLVDVTNSCADGFFNIYTSSNYYYHENTMNIESEFINEDDEQIQYDEGMILRECRNIAVELYRSLEDDYEYLTSEKAILETLQCNEYFFDLSGNIRG